MAQSGYRTQFQGTSTGNRRS